MTAADAMEHKRADLCGRVSAILLEYQPLKGDKALELPHTLYDSIIKDCLICFKSPISPLELFDTGDEGQMALILRKKAPRAATAEKKGYLARVSYVQRRMWMLSRHAKGEAHCPKHARAALMHTVTALCRGGTFHALNACDALLGMTYGKPPNRQAREEAAHVAYMAASALRLIYEDAINALNQGGQHEHKMVRS